jgi:hypothetical protein
VFVLSNVEPFLVKPFLIDKTQPPKLLKVWWFFALSGNELFKSSGVRHTSPSLFPSFSTGRRMGVILMLCGAPSGNEETRSNKKER